MMTVREGIGLVFLIAGVAIVPLGWIVSHKILLFAGLLLGIGVWLFYTARIIKQEEQIAKESTGSSNYGPSVPGDIHNYTGWRSGGRTQPLDTTLDGADGD